MSQQYRSLRALIRGLAQDRQKKVSFRVRRLR